MYGLLAGLRVVERSLPGEDGWPKQERGVVPEVPGLYFVGLLFQYAFASMLIGGAARDAKHVVRHITRTRAQVDLATERESAGWLSAALRRCDLAIW